MDSLIDSLTGGHVAEVKIVLTSIVAALAMYQTFLMAVGYGKLRIRFLTSRTASFTHRGTGDAIVPITLLVAIMCLGYFGIEDALEHAPRPVTLHMISGFLLLLVLTIKIAVVRWWHGMGRFLPALGISVLTLFVITWLSSAGVYL
ncbi:MAG: hypothetical protein H0W21_09265 [Actinobacteria bacterium]|nr:hypothetical protein [Actinomycetota bacterium]